MLKQGVMQVVIYCIEYTFKGKTQYIEITAKSKREAIKILMHKTELPEFEYTMWIKEGEWECGKS